MTIVNSDEKRIVLNKFLRSGINVSPNALDFILKLENPLKKVDEIVKETSFFPTFTNHLTEDFLSKISNEEIQKVLKRNLFKEKSIIIEANQGIQSDFIEKDEIPKENTEIKELKSAIIDVNKSKDFTNLSNNKKNLSQVLLKAKYNPKIGMSESKKRIKPFESIKSSFSFKPIAKEYSLNYKIVKDPTGKLYTTGAYNDFYEMTRNKFNKLRTLMRKRNEVLSANTINKILRLSHNTEVSAIGMVNEIRQTEKGNYFLTLEDLTGKVNVLVRKESENQDLVKIVESTIKDQMVYVEGTYNAGENKNRGIIFVNFISKINIPTDFRPNISPDPLSIALISDAHIGSKEFEESLWNRFMDFLNGKIGNKNMREIAGRIKYIIINGDLVDGIGVYPSQQQDLSISDIYLQYKKASELVSKIPEYIKIFYSSGNHEPVRNAIPRPAVPKKYSKELMEQEVTCVGNPSLIQTHDVNTLVFHGDSMIDMNMLIPHLENDRPVDTMKELLICRHLAPIFGERTQIAPTSKDWLLIDKIPDIFHTGHIHINGIGQYRNVTLVNSGCFQTQTDFMKSFGISPTPGIVPVIELDSFKSSLINLKKNN